MDIGNEEINKKMFYDNTRRSLRRNISLISFDQIVGGWSYPSWNEKWSDRIGYSTKYRDLFIDLFKGIHKVAEEEGKDIAVSVEETNEFYIPYFRSHVTRQADSFSILGGGTSVFPGYTYSTNIPLFAHVYSKYALSFDECAYLHADTINNPAYSWFVARVSLLANVPCVYGRETLNDNTVKFFKRIISMVDNSFKGQIF